MIMIIVRLNEHAYETIQSTTVRWFTAKMKRGLCEALK